MLRTGEELLSEAGPCLMEDERGIQLYDINSWTFSLNSDGKIERQKCYLYTLPYEENFLNVTTSSGRSITVTKNHPFLVNDQGRICWKRAEDITRNDFLSVSKTLPEINAAPLMTHEEALTHLRKPVQEIPFDEDFAFWIGFVLSDGSIGEKHVEVCQKNHPSYLERFVRISNKFGYNVSVTENRGCRYARIYSKGLVEYLKLRYGIENGKNKRIPSWFLGLPKPLAREFLNSFIGLESSMEKGRITFTQKRKEDVNIVAYLLLRFSVRFHVRHDGRIHRLRIFGADVKTYLDEIGWPTPFFETERKKQSSFKVVPINRKDATRIVSLFGMDRFHTIKGRPKTTAKQWYNSYKGLKQGETVMAEKHFTLFTRDMREELQTRKSCAYRELLETNPRAFASGIGVSMEDIAKGIGVSHNQVWKLYADGSSSCQTTVQEYLSLQYEEVISEAETIIKGLENIACSDVCFERVRTVQEQKGKPRAFGLTVDEHHNYIAGFGACGINHNTYPLPEAQTDRFLLKILVGYPGEEDELEIVNRYTKAGANEQLRTLLSKDSLKLLQTLTRQVPIANDIKKRAVQIVAKTRNMPDEIEFGASPRASIGLILASKARALIQGRKFVSSEDLDAMAYPVLRHRLVLSFKAERDGKKPDDIVAQIIKTIK
ncbi:MAG: hypothetical protein ABIA93_03310 [Candidatus Woesearchaeota archaeon]